MPKTRSAVVCEVFGAPTELINNVLPTYSDVMKAFLLTRIVLKEKQNHKDPSVTDVATNLMLSIKNIWQKASLPVVSNQQILHKIKECNEKYKSIKKNIKSIHNKRCLEKLNIFKISCEKLFDISACKCKNFSLCKCKHKIPVSERKFLLDQRTVRKMAIGKIDLETTKKNEKRMNRKILESRKRTKYEDEEQLNEKQTVEIMEDKLSSSGSENSSNISVSSDDNFGCASDVITSTSKKTSQSQARLKLPHLATACDRTGISDRAASIIVSSVLQDIGVITKQDPSRVIDRSKIRRERKKCRKDLQETCYEEFSRNSDINGINFDGRKDKTLVAEKIGLKYHSKTIIEEHVVLVSEPGEKYLGHVTPISGKANSIKDSIINFLQNVLKTNLQKIVVIGCDGTIVNTGLKNGVIRQFETVIGKPVHWFICLLHCNELPLRHLMEHLDGKTKDPKGFSGVIGRALDNCEHMPVVIFEKIHVILPLVTFHNLSTDQKYLYEMCSAISAGKVSFDLSQRQPGKMAHARWLTTANRILRLYVASEKPSEQLRILTHYIVKVYSFSWFEIKTKPSCLDGPKHIFSIIRESRYLPNELKAIIYPVIERNAYFCHPENILLAMLADARKYIRELGLRRILKCRSESDNKEGIRYFKVPKLNFDAEDYVDLIDWMSVIITEPPLTKEISNDKLQMMILDVPDKIDISRYPCHNQAVERCVKLVTEASASVCGRESRDGFIHARIASRKDLPHFETKKEFVQGIRIFTILH